MLEKIKVFIKDHALEKIYTEYFQTMQHAEYYVLNENNFMNKSLEIIYPTDENNTKDNC